ncbi:ketosteroid isomerase-like protein [Leeuwenhoekiella aestuarii]|uniref:Ketosteroid isomerase-like protein n=1 Tax=Leeuwenhoekiella aestuarii TaxID=2249426 RepID=A0A4Q0NNJ8_9FLAO|nr:nuclear transport factor 2 family protein [Leeuwenhoekiella aestuarii]RXG11422.1 ketosteroid isomerase-like protein [Leeuwenhoekiella aestuarii]RXG12159.1 ketosteroid isomerase-like protein [Leeuwenhoekiella aestuarii]
MKEVKKEVSNFKDNNISQPPSINGFVASEEEKKIILEKREKWRQDFEARDVEAIMSYYVDDILSYDLMAPIQFEGEKMWRDNWINFFKFFPAEIKITLEDLTVFQEGNLAALRGLTRLTATTMDGNEVDMWARESNVLRKIDGEWLIVHDHISVPMDFENGMALTDLKPIGV